MLRSRSFPIIHEEIVESFMLGIFYYFVVLERIVGLCQEAYRFCVLYTYISFKHKKCTVVLKRLET